jgi:hypothetical protein
MKPAARHAATGRLGIGATWLADRRRKSCTTISSGARGGIIGAGFSKANVMVSTGTTTLR